MSKRRADVQLTRDNFENSDEEGESSSEPKSQTAPAEVLKTRVFARAKRQLTSNNSDNSSTKDLFSGFKGFQSFSSTSKPTSSFNFGATATSTPAQTFSFGLNNLNNNNNNSTNNSKTMTFGKANNTETPIVANAYDENNSHVNNKADGAVSPDESFVSDLTSLNKIFFDHIKKYMDKNELYDFTSVCEEYISHYKKLKESKPSANSCVAKLEVKSSVEQSKSSSSSMFKIPSFVDSAASTSSSTKFSFSTASKSIENKPMFSFGASSSFPISFPSTQTSIFSSTTNNSGDANDATEESGEAEDAPPPKVASVEHQEEDAVYSKKCKLYYKKDDQFTEKGVGFLYIKVKDNESKPQLLIRAGTSTGNILLNIALVESLPVSKAEGKGVLLTCVPNPPLETKKKTDSESDNDKKTVTFLIRVKKEDSDELMDTITKYKSSA